MNCTFHPENTIPARGAIFVFESNGKGAHAKGSAKVARTNFRAQHGVCRGRTGDAYAIQTRDRRQLLLPLPAIEEAVKELLQFAAGNPKLNLFISRTGCGIDGYPDEAIASFFEGAPANCSLPEAWAPLLNTGSK